MRSLLLVLTLAACTESDEDRLADLRSQVEITCGYGGNDCFPDPEAVASCMNNALVSGKRAQLIMDRTDIEEFSFTINHRVNVWQRYHPVSLDDGITATELFTCSGTYVVGEQCGMDAKYVRLTGCR